MHYTIDPVLEYTNLMYASVPLMVGYYKNGFYAGLGVKIGIPVLSRITLSYSYTTSATYSDYIEDFEDMFNHNYGLYQTSNRSSIDAMIKYSGVAEIGYNLLSKASRGLQDSHHGFRVAAVCEYGFNNVLTPKESSVLYEINPQNASQLTINPYYFANMKKGQFFHPLYVGVKLSWTFCLSEGKCDCE
jgi:hypothetical protein